MTHDDEREHIARMAAVLDTAGVRREAAAPRAVDPLRAALEAAIADTEADLIADADVEERIDLNVYEVSLPLETARSISAALAAAPQPAPVDREKMVEAIREAVDPYVDVQFDARDCASDTADALIADGWHK